MTEVDLDSIMEEMDEYKKSRRTGQSDMKLVKDAFAEAYKKHFGGAFEFKKLHWYSVKKKSGEVVKVKCKSDRSALYNLFKDCKIKYDIEIDDFIEYLDYIVKEGFDFCETQRQLFGLVMSEKQVDKYFIRVVKKKAYQRKNRQMQNMADRHADLFQS